MNSVSLPQRFIQTELGTEKYCKGCDDYYPADQEFFFGTGLIKRDGTPSLETLCKACYKEKYKRSTKRSNDVSHRYGVNLVSKDCGGLVRDTWSNKCKGCF